MPQEEIEKFAERIDERGISEMLAIENYDVQETRRLAREEERRMRLAAEREKQDAVRKQQEAERKKQEAVCKKQEAEWQAGALAQLLLKQGLSPKSIAESLATTEQKIIELVSLSPQVQDLRE